MVIETRALAFDNLLIYKKRQLRSEWQEGIAIMEDFILTEGFYKNGPVFFSVEPVENEPSFGLFTYYLPINESVRLSDETVFQFQRKLHIPEALVLRQANEAADFYEAHEHIKQFAAQNDFEIDDTFYCVLLEVFDDFIIDLYVPIKSVGAVL